MKRFLCVFLALLLLTSCVQTPSENIDSSESDIENEVIEDIAQYTVVIPRYSTMGELDIGLLLQKTIKEKAKVDLKLISDNKEYSGKEILIGKTSREQSQGEFKYNDYVIKKDGDDIVINGGGNSALKMAVELFLDEFVSDKVSVPVNEYTKTFEYPLENATVNGILLSDFAISGKGEEFDALRNAIGGATGIMPKQEGENTV